MHEAAPVAEWLPELAKAVGAKPPFRIPVFLGRLILPEHLFVMMTDVRGGSKAKFKRTFNWRPEFSTWRDGFRRGLGHSIASACTKRYRTAHQCPNNRGCLLRLSAVSIARSSRDQSQPAEPVVFPIFPVPAGVGIEHRERQAYRMTATM